MQEELDLVWKHLLPAVNGPTDPGEDRALRRQLAGRAVKAPAGAADSATLDRIAGREFEVRENVYGLRSVSFQRRGDGVAFSFRDAGGVHAIPCGAYQWIRAEAPAPLGLPRIIAGGAPKREALIRVAGRAAWRSENELELTWRYYETPHTDTVTCRFEGNEVTLTPLSSINRIRGGKKDARAAVVATRRD